MAGNKHPWRDVYSPQAWTEILRLTDAVNDDANHVADPITGANLLESIHSKLWTYHKIEKTDRNRIKDRMQALDMISEAAIKYLNVKNGQFAKANPAVHKGIPQNTNPHLTTPASPISPMATEQNIDRWVYSLGRRAEKKRNYLYELRHFLKSDNDNLDSADKFMKYVNKAKLRRQQSNRSLLDIDPGAIVEKWDPLHRNLEIDIDKVNDQSLEANNLIGRAFLEWLQGNRTENFLLWLEGHPLCTFSKYVDTWTARQGSQYMPFLVKGVAYSPDDEIKQVWVKQGKLYARSLIKPNEAKRSFTWSGQQHRKNGDAFVWLKHGELLVHPHKSGVFHHSSFVAGDAVRCAGILKAEQGFITAIDNNSGHYKTPDAHFVAFLNRLDKDGALHKDVRVGSSGITNISNGNVNRTTLDQFRKKAADKRISGFFVKSRKIRNFYL